MLPSSDVQGEARVCKTRKALDQLLVIVAECPRVADEDLVDAFGLGFGAELNKVCEFLFVSWRSWRCAHLSKLFGSTFLRKSGRITLCPQWKHGATCRDIGFDNLSPIIWMKISNAAFEANESSKFLRKPYEPNAIIKNDLEYILMLRKPGDYRHPTEKQRELSRIGKEDFRQWCRQTWSLPGARTREHPAPFPLQLANRLVRMFSFVDDTVLDPFAGSGTTLLAAAKAGRNSIGVEIERSYCDLARQRFETELHSLAGQARLISDLAPTIKISYSNNAN